MVLMTVSYEYRPYSVGVFCKICHVRYDKIYAEHFFIGKAQSAVYNDNIFAVLKYGHVLSYFTNAAEQDYF